MVSTLELGSRANRKEISGVQFQTEKREVSLEIVHKFRTDFPGVESSNQKPSVRGGETDIFWTQNHAF